MIPIKDDNPTKTFPFVTIAIIVINLLVFIYQLTLGKQAQQFVMELGAIPKEVTNFQNLSQSTMLPPFASVFTCMFLHGGFMHLIGNMLYLWIFGNNIEDTIGHFKFIGFYLICGVVASFTHILASPNATIPIIGASGAIAGILGAYVLLFPRARILTVVPIFYFIRILYLPAFVVLGFWFVIQIFNITTQRGGGVAWFAHVGGFLVGLALIKLFEKRKEEAD